MPMLVNTVLERIRAEYLEMPGLLLTLAQAQRLFGIERTLCQAVLDALVDAKFLRATSDGRYTRPVDGAAVPRDPVSASQAPQRDAPSRSPLAPRHRRVASGRVVGSNSNEGPMFHPQDDPSRFLAAIVDSSDDAIIGKDLDGIIVSWNGGAERLYGHRAQDVIGRSITLLMPADRQHEFATVMERIRAGARVAPYETIRQAVDGRLIDVSLTISPVLGANGQVVGAATIARDITSRIQAERAGHTSELRWRAVVESAVDGIVVIDAGGCIDAFNPAAERLFGYQEGEILGQNVSMLMPSPHHEEHDGYLARYLATGHRGIIGTGREVVGRRRDGTTFPLHLSVGEMIDGRERKFTGILHDLTSRKRTEEVRLEARVGERTRIARELHDTLLGSLHALLLRLQIAFRRLPENAVDARTALEEAIEQASRAIDEGKEVVQELRLFTRENNELAIFIRTMGEEFASADSNDTSTPFRVRVEGTPRALHPTVRDEVHRLAAEALRNAIRHAGADNVEVVIGYDEKSLRLRVRDDGRGIRPEILRGDGRRGHYGLQGMRERSELVGGQLTIRSELSRGTEVDLIIPASTAYVNSTPVQELSAAWTGADGLKRS
jgi:PAS domain S-box-containing protein